jgi:hypothetical protein
LTAIEAVRRRCRVSHAIGEETESTLGEVVLGLWQILPPDALGDLAASRIAVGEAIIRGGDHLVVEVAAGDRESDPSLFHLAEADAEGAGDDGPVRLPKPSWFG